MIMPIIVKIDHRLTNHCRCRMGADQPEVAHNHPVQTLLASRQGANTSSCGGAPGWACGRSWARSSPRAPPCTPGS